MRNWEQHYPHEKDALSWGSSLMRWFRQRPKVEHLDLVVQRSRIFAEGQLLTYTKGGKRTYWIVDKVTDSWENGNIATTELSCRPTIVPLPNWFEVTET